jgi:hypothetical protein
LSGDYAAFGLQIHSEIDLPELAPGKATTVADVSIRLERLAPLDDRLRGLQRIGDDAFLRVRNVALFRIRGGREIAIDPAPGASARNVRLFLLGSALGALCHQRGLMPLHASAIVTGRRAVAFAGPTGVGKSTLTAHYQSRGHEILCDDVCVVSFDEAGRPLAWPGLPRIKLWQDALDRFGLARTDLERTHDGVDKFHLPLPAQLHREPVPLEAVYVLSDAVGWAPEVTALSGVAAVEALLRNIYRPQYLRPMNLAEQAFRQTVRIANQAGVFEAPRVRGFEVFAPEAARLERHFSLSVAAALT